MKRRKNYGYSIGERNKVAMETSHMAHEYTLEGIICIVCGIAKCGIANDKTIRTKMRAIMGNTMEAYLDCPVNIYAQRDYKGYYTKAFK